MSSRSRWAEQWMVWAAALIGPVVVTAVLVNFSHQVQRDYVFIYLGLVPSHRPAAFRRPDTTSELIRRLAGVDVHILRVREPAV